MSAWRIDGTVSRMMFAKAGSPSFADVNRQRTPLEPGEDLHGSPAWISSSVLDRGLSGARRFAEYAGRRSSNGDTRLAWFEFRNKIVAFRLFQGRDDAGRPLERDAVAGLDVYRRLFAAEGLSHRDARPGVAVRELSLPSFSPVSVHAGVGLRLAEPTLAEIHAGGCIEKALNEFFSACERDAVEGCAGIMEEELGLLARTLYPHLVERIDARLQETDKIRRDRFWHGVGRGIYFAPSNLPPFRAAPWSGLKMCGSEPPHAAGVRNAISGFCFALAMVNLRQPEILDSLFRHHATEAVACMDGIRAVIAVWEVSGGDRETLEQIAGYRPEAPTARVLWPLLWPGSADPDDYRRPERMFSASDIDCRNADSFGEETDLR